MFIYHGKPVSYGEQIEINGVFYPGEWVRIATDEQRKELGITEVPDPVRPDDRFYNVSSTLNSSFQYDATPKDIAELKASFIAQMKSTAHSLLAPTDWLVIRQIE
ncbi:MAG: hypothetical protein ACKO96_45690, partial [Flammeovirgaceae bacterium]